MHIKWYTANHITSKMHANLYPDSFLRLTTLAKSTRNKYFISLIFNWNNHRFPKIKSKIDWFTQMENVRCEGFGHVNSVSYDSIFGLDRKPMLGGWQATREIEILRENENEHICKRQLIRHLIFALLKSYYIHELHVAHQHQINVGKSECTWTCDKYFLLHKYFKWTMCAMKLHF